MDTLDILQPPLMLFIAIDPIGTIPYYHALTSRMSVEEKKSALKLAILVASIFLLAFTLIGDFIFSLFNITINDFRIAAGLILLISSIAMLLEVPLGAIRGEPERLAIVPLATPLLAGPAAISIVIYIKYHWGLHIALASIAINAIIAYAILSLSVTIMKLVGRQGLLVLDKFMSLVMAALAISLIRQGLLESI